jgi:P27 family predicted phage terminase small subunit
VPNPRRSKRDKILSGTLRADREPQTDFTERLTEPPPPPKELSEKAAVIWTALAAAAVGIGTLTAADLPLLGLLVSTMTAEADARATLATEGMTIVAGSGGLKKHPAASIAETARSQALQMMKEFGLSPRARQSVDTTPPVDRTPNVFAEFFGAADAPRGRAS